MSTDGEAYNPEIYARGAVSGYLKDDSESDSCGTWERGHVTLLGLFSAQGFKNIQYHSIDGVDQDGELKGCKFTECRWFEINFHAVLEMPDEDGELLKRLSHFKARVVGRRLEPLMRRVRVGRQVTIHPSGKVDDQSKPQVDSIEIALFEPEEM